MSHNGKSKRVFWTGDEQMKICAHVYEQGIRSVHSTDLLSAVRAAQKAVLPSARQRSITAHMHIKGLLETLAPYLKQRMTEDRLRTMQEEPRPPIPSPEQINEQIAAGVLPTAPVPEPSPAAATISSSIDLALEALAGALAERFVEHLRAALSSVADHEVAAFIKHDRQHKVKKRRVLIMGLLPQQAGLMTQEYGMSLDLRFVESNMHGGAIRNKADHSDYVLAMTNFMNHSMEDVVKKHPGYIRISGGLDTLRTKLAELCSMG